MGGLLRVFYVGAYREPPSEEKRRRTRGASHEIASREQKRGQDFANSRLRVASVIWDNVPFTIRRIEPLIQEFYRSWHRWERLSAMALTVTLRTHLEMVDLE